MQERVKTSIAPWLNVNDSRAALSFYKAAFCAQELYLLELPDGVIARLSIDGATFWLAPDEGPSLRDGQGKTIRMIMTVEDPDAMFQRAVAAGARVINPMNEDHGWRVGRVKDPFGHHWEIGKEI